MNSSDDLDVAIAAARAGGAAAMPFYGSATSGLSDPRAPVTEADRASNAAILEVLQERRPHDAVLSEEEADSGARLGRSRVWIVDPLDGTKEFLAENGEFSIMVGLAIDGAAAIGAVYQPAADRLFLGAIGVGAWVETGGERRALVAPPAGPQMRLVGSRSHADPLTTRIVERLGIEDVVPSGSVGVKCGLIALGRRNLYVHPVPYLKEWDTCAPEVVLRAAGGEVTDCRGARLRYNKPVPTQPDGILAYAPGLPEGVRSEIEAIVGEAAE